MRKIKTDETFQAYKKYKRQYEELDQLTKEDLINRHLEIVRFYTMNLILFIIMSFILIVAIGMIYLSGAM